MTLSITSNAFGDVLVNLTPITHCAADCGCAGGQPATTCMFDPGCPRCGTIDVLVCVKHDVHGNPRNSCLYCDSDFCAANPFA